jgi:hypothetical protein
MPFIIIAALMGGALAIPAQASDPLSEEVVSVRRFDVPEPRGANLRLNTPKRPTALPVGTSVPAVAAQAGPLPVSTVTGNAAPVASGPVFTLEQPGLPPGARDAALNAAAPVAAGTVTPAPGTLNPDAVEHPVAVADPAANAAGLPPAPVFQTMKQAASAVPVDRVIPTAIAPVAPEVVDTSLQGQVSAFITAYPMALPGGAIFLVFLAFLFKRFRVKRSIYAAGQ